MLADRLVGTAPYGWEGEQATVTDYVVHTIGNLGGSGLAEAELEDLGRFLMVLEGPPHASADSEVVRRGRSLFEDSAAGCGACHSGRASTDTAVHDLGNVPVDTPSLRFVRGTAPYFHDGRYPTLEALLADPASRMGHAASLPESDRAALAVFLRSL
jgi:cytochrome c peroxidase